jgi:hypothetical protein
MQVEERIGDAQPSLLGLKLRRAGVEVAVTPVVVDAQSTSWLEASAMIY